MTEEAARRLADRLTEKQKWDIALLARVLRPPAGSEEHGRRRAESMNELVVFDYNDKEVRTVQQNGEPWFVLKDVCQVLDLGSPHKVAERLDEDEKGRNQIPTPGGVQEMTIINESGLYAVILRSDKPEAKPFRKWITAEVLPSIRKTGRYEARPVSEVDRLLADAQERTARVSEGRFWTGLAEKYTGTWAQVLDAYATKAVAGEFVLPLPELAEKTYSAAEIGERLGVSGTQVGRLTSQHGLKTDTYGKWFHDKGRYSGKEVQSFRYYETVIPVLTELLRGEETNMA